MSMVKTPNMFSPKHGDTTTTEDEISEAICKLCKVSDDAVGFECDHFQETCFPAEAIHPDTIKALKKRGDHE
jgi:hypothetical protein